MRHIPDVPMISVMDTTDLTQVSRGSRRRPFWFIGHAFMIAAVVMWVIGQIQYSSAPADDNFLAGFVMFVYGTFALLIGLLVYAGTGLFALIAHIRHRHDPRRTVRSSSEMLAPVDQSCREWDGWPIARCETCGTEGGRGDRFCGQCGTPRSQALR